MWVVIAVVLVTGLNILGIRLLADVNLVFVAAQFVFIAVFAAMAIGEDHQRRRGRVVDRAVLRLGHQPRARVRRRRDPRAVVPRLRRGVDAVGGDGEPAREDPARDHPVRARRRARLHLPVLPRRTSRSRTGSRSPTTRTSASADVMTFIGGDFLNSFFTAAYVAGAFACAMASQASVSRILFAMGRDGSLPRPIFFRLHPRYRTPVTGERASSALFGLTALFISLATVSSMISLRRARGVLVREPRGDQDLRDRPGPAQRRGHRQVRGDPVPRLRVHDLPVDAAERARRSRSASPGSPSASSTCSCSRAGSEGAAGDVHGRGRGGARGYAVMRAMSARCSCVAPLVDRVRPATRGSRPRSRSGRRRSAARGCRGQSTRPSRSHHWLRVALARAPTVVGERDRVAAPSRAIQSRRDDAAPAVGHERAEPRVVAQRRAEAAADRAPSRPGRR